MTTTIEAVQAEIIRVHDPEQAKHGMVYQVWEDGEITLQKAGPLLWRRTLHSIYPGTSGLPLLQLPEKFINSRDNLAHSYAFVTFENAILIRNLIRMLPRKE